ncbi:MAG: F420-dependent NADP oxidoreductase [Candidatus Rokubacteria bacterium 13_1_40CM_69_27]|nr:MAG: F420-dependent NADP oxidoreductase [Candidatus Rokubacteria bacterium 13_1_40CM_69_27]OLC35456.1 MAG: F420-dependent NADP oxidoreductase [Candidatus Rokubacteria bacterium 13_1_40CM_4_69_5]
MKIAIIGAGNVGGTLGKAWAARGHDVVFGVRDPHDRKLDELLKDSGGRAQAASVRNAVAAADIVVLAVPWGSAQDAIRGAGDLRGKVVVDATNPLKPDLSGLALGHTTSAGEEIARWAAGAKVVKAFNTIGAQHMANPRFDGQSASMFICGDDAAAKKTVASLAAALGFEPVDAGPLTQARLLEPLALLWISMAYAYGQGTDIAFRLLRR